MRDKIARALLFFAVFEISWASGLAYGAQERGDAAYFAGLALLLCAVGTLTWNRDAVTAARRMEE